MTGRIEVGLPAVLLGGTALLAALAPVVSPERVVIVAPLDGPGVAAPAAAVSLAAVTLAAAGLLLARRWDRLARSRRPAAQAIGHAHILTWTGLLVAVWLLAFPDVTGFTTQVGIIAYALGLASGWASTRDRPQALPNAVQQPAHPGDAVAWTGSARLTADVAAPLAITLFVVIGPAFATMLYADTTSGPALVATGLFLLLLYGGQLRAMWVTVTIGANGIRIRTGPFGRVVHRSWHEIGAVEVVDAELSTDSLLWARGVGRRVVLRPGPALRIRRPQRHRPALTVSVDHAEQASAVATRHLIEAGHRG